MTLLLLQLRQGMGMPAIGLHRNAFWTPRARMSIPVQLTSGRSLACTIRTKSWAPPQRPSMLCSVRIP